MSRYFPGFGTQIGRSSEGYAKSGGSGMRSGPSALESGLHSSAGRSKARGGAGHADEGSIDGSEVELAQTKSNPFEVHVVREVSMGVENGNDSQGQMGVRGYITPAVTAPERARSKASRGV